MEKAKPKHYWGVVAPTTKPLAHGRIELHTGTFKNCWEWLTKRYGHVTMHDLSVAGIRIERIG